MKIISLKYYLIIILLFSFNYTQNYAQQFTEQTSISLAVADNAAWGDYDNDNDLDILLFGGQEGTGGGAKVYRNNGNNTFTEIASISIYEQGGFSAAWGDYDNDGDLDILLSVDSTYSSTSVSKVYRNNGNDTFSEQVSISLNGVSEGSSAWIDYDNDGDLDIFLTGQSLSVNPISKIYRNNGNNTFTEQTSISLYGLRTSSSAWGDYNNDGFMDLILTGWDIEYNLISKIYRNNLGSTFIDQTSIYLTPVHGGSTAWGDYDNDGDLDILLTGYHASGRVSKVYRNDGSNKFKEPASIVLADVVDGTAAWGDYDNDGDLDILLAGHNAVLSYQAFVYRNNGNNTFTRLTNFPGHTAAWGDYDNDGDLDILVTGWIANSTYISKIYRNNNTKKNTLPSPPANLHASAVGNEVTFSWDKSIDSQTPQNGLTYNLVIGSNPNEVDKLSPMSDRRTGYRRVVNLGNTNQNTSWTIKGLPDGQYFWSVQGIDNNFAGSNFAKKSKVKIKNKNGSPFRKNSDSVEVTLIPTEYELYQNYPNPFNPSTVIGYSLPSETYVTLTVYDVLGNEIVKLVDENKNAGTYEVTFDGSNLVNGIYIYRLQAGNSVQLRKMILLK